MLKIVSLGMFALFVTVPMAYAQAPSGGAQERLSAADRGALTDARIAIVKSTLQLTPDQEKYWTAVESAIRQRANDRQARLTNVEQTVGERRENPVEAMRDRNPIDFMHRRANALTQRGTDLDKLADAWQPLYQTLTPEQKKRMGFLAMYVLRELRSGAEERRVQSQDSETD